MKMTGSTVLVFTARGRAHGEPVTCPTLLLRSAQSSDCPTQRSTKVNFVAPKQQLM